MPKRPIFQQKCVDWLWLQWKDRSRSSSAGFAEPSLDKHYFFTGKSNPAGADVLFERRERKRTVVSLDPS